MTYDRANLTQVPDDAVLPAEIAVFVNERTYSLPRGATVLDAVRTSSPEDADALSAGRTRVTDSRGLPLAPDAVITGGAILRVMPVRDKQADDN
ncbi:MAG: hypothetical protein H7Z40_14145 [Phycisphaerae bacterium]|nr:hypothetical protein [Gemmatimonadaceae bacterium]